MKLLKQIAVRIIPTGVLAFLTFAAIAYQRGYYDFTFIERPTDTLSASQLSVDTDSAHTDTEPTDTDVTTDTEPVSADTDSAGDSETPEISETAAYLNSLPDAYSVCAYGEYRISDSVYDASTMSLARVTIDTVMPSEYSLREREVTAYDIEFTDKLGNVSTAKTVTELRPAVEVYMDYIIVDDGQYVTLFDQYGHVFAQNFDIDYYRPAYTRDSDDIPQFISTELSKNGKSTITTYTMFQDGEFIISDYKDVLEGRGLYYNYPAYFGKADESPKRIYSNTEGIFAYTSNYGTTAYRYNDTYGYFNGVAAVTIYDDSIETPTLSYISDRYRTLITGSASSGNHGPYYNLSGRRVSSVYRLPETTGVESIGYLYFDHGLVRIRQQEYDFYHTYDSLAYEYGHHYAKCYTDSELILREDGSEFQLPRGYTVISYSDGIFCLMKDRKYGYFDYTGKWIVQPTYDSATYFSEGMAVVSKGGKSALIDTNGNLLTPFVFDKIQPVSSGLIAAYEETVGWVILSKISQYAISE